MVSKTVGWCATDADGASALGYDYADQRYYTGGRFSTPDPYMASGGVASPSSWNRYAYVEGDPVNYRDPKGLDREGGSEELVYCVYFGTYTTQTLCELAANGTPNGNPGGKLCRDGSTRNNGEPCPDEPGGGGPSAYTSCATQFAPEMPESDWQSFFGDVTMDGEELLDLTSPEANSKSSSNEVIPAFAVAAATAAQWVVYYARTPSGQYYIGVTSNFAARQAQHASRFSIQLIAGLPKMNYAAAKGMEQNFIEQLRASGHQLANKINSISPNSQYYNRFKYMAGDVLSKCSNTLSLPWK